LTPRVDRALLETPEGKEESAMGRPKSLRPTEPEMPRMRSGAAPRRNTLGWGLATSDVPPVSISRYESGVASTRTTRRPEDRAKGSDEKRGSGRRAVVIDEVGDSAVRIARRSPPRASAPRCVATAMEVRGAPIDQKSMFLLSHVDGLLDEDGLVDATGMKKSEVRRILEELMLLGLVALPE
jgi:hypothetical protein